MTDTTNDFDAIVKAMSDGNDAELTRLMAVEPTENNDEEVKEEETNEEAPLIPDESDADTESEGSPKVEDVEDDDDTSTEAASSAASTDVTKSEREVELEKELNKLRSDAGRVPFIQRRMSELEREVRAYKARETQTTPGKDGKKADDVELDEETQREINELKEVDPALARTLERVAKAALSASKSNSEHVVTTFTQAEQEREEYNFLMEQKAELAKVIPQHEQIFALPEWKTWKETLTPGQRALAESSYASEAAQAIYAFAAVMKQNQPATPAVVVPPVSTENEKLKEARERKVGVSAEVKTSAAKKTAVLDPDAYFAEQYNKIGKQNHILP